MHLHKACLMHCVRLCGPSGRFEITVHRNLNPPIGSQMLSPGSGEVMICARQSVSVATCLHQVHMPRTPAEQAYSVQILITMLAGAAVGKCRFTRGWACQLVSQPKFMPLYIVSSKSTGQISSCTLAPLYVHVPAYHKAMTQTIQMVVAFGNPSEP